MAQIAYNDDGSRQRGHALEEDSKSQRPGRRPTIYDVAAEAGVAASTVSRALSRPGRVSADTAALVRDAAKKVGYWREERKPVLEYSASRLFGMLVADIGNPVFAALAHGATRAANKEGYTLLVAHFAESDIEERLVAERLVSNVEGVILASPRLSNSGIRTISKHRPAVVLNREVPGVPSILTDGERGAQEAIRHLANLGHEAVTYLSGPPSSWSDGTRWRGIESAGRQRLMTVRRTAPAAPVVRSGREAVQEWLERPTSAVIGFNDMLAIGFMRELESLGARIPEDVSILGFDNSVTSALTSPTLTSVASPLMEQGAYAVNLLLRMIRRERVADQPVFLPLNLVGRESTGQFERNPYEELVRDLREAAR